MRARVRKRDQWTRAVRIEIAESPGLFDARIDHCVRNQACDAREIVSCVTRNDVVERAERRDRNDGFDARVDTGKLDPDRSAVRRTDDSDRLDQARSFVEPIE